LADRCQHLLITLFFEFKMKKVLQFILIISSLINFGCKEEYFPEIENAEKLLVVDGTLTDETNVVTINLSRTVPFQETANEPEIGASVILSDDKGREFTFMERPPGVYKSKAFTYEYDRIYVLNIQTKNKKKYKSSPQKLYPKSAMQSVTSIIKAKTLQTAHNDVVYTKTYSGLEFATTLKSNAENSGYFRFENTVLVEYLEKNIYTANPDSFPGFFYCWKKYYPNEAFNLNDKKLNNLNEYQHTLAFCPIDTNYFSIIQKAVGEGIAIKYVTTRDLYYFAITVKQYQINKDAYQYFDAINVQIEAKNRIFDPVSFQVRGNIFCITDPDEPVLGAFEVASVNTRTYSFSDFKIDKSVKYQEIDTLDIESLSMKGSLYDEYPDFWIYNY